MLDLSHQSRIRGLSSLISNTPLLAIEFTFDGEKRTLYAKAENLNMTGSIKDRMALHILEQGYERGILNPGNLVIEACSPTNAITAMGLGMDHATALPCEIAVKAVSNDGKTRSVNC